MNAEMEKYGTDTRETLEIIGVHLRNGDFDKLTDATILLENQYWASGIEKYKVDRAVTTCNHLVGAVLLREMGVMN